jgi:hypothetical protein
MSEADKKRGTWKKPPRDIALICGGIVFLTVVAYSLNFGKSDVSKDPDHWAKFGDYFGGVLNPAIAIVNLGVVVYIATQLDNFRKKQTLAFNLHQEWNSREMYLSRTEAGSYVKSHPNLNFKEIEHSTDSNVVDLWIVMGFFQRLSALVDQKEVNDELIVKLFLPLFVWWWVMCFKENLPYDWDAWQPIHDLRDWFQEKARVEYRNWYAKYKEEKSKSLNSKLLPQASSTVGEPKKRKK